jgi:hypothetical protein
LLIANLTKFIERLAKNGEASHVKKALELIRQLNTSEAKPVITNRSSIWKLEQVAEVKREQKADLQNKESIVEPFNGGQIVFNYQAERLQVVHDQKPAQAIINLLKENAFRWSPSQQCWQRQLTNNCLYIFNHFVKSKLIAG